MIRIITALSRNNAGAIIKGIFSLCGLGYPAGQVNALVIFTFACVIDKFGKFSCFFFAGVSYDIIDVDFF